MGFKPGDRVVHGVSHGTITRRASLNHNDERVWYVRWDDTGHVGFVWACDLQPEGERDD